MLNAKCDGIKKYYRIIFFTLVCINDLNERIFNVRLWCLFCTGMIRIWLKLRRGVLRRERSSEYFRDTSGVLYSCVTLSLSGTDPNWSLKPKSSHPAVSSRYVVTWKNRNVVKMYIVLYWNFILNSGIQKLIYFGNHFGKNCIICNERNCFKCLTVKNVLFSYLII